MLIMEKKLNLWMPITKDPATGKYHAVLSDESLDRDGEAMGKELIHSWGKSNVLPALANHENSMEKWVGGWENIKTIEKDGMAAVIADPWFFSKEANPLAAQIKKQIDEAIKRDLNPGISVGAIVHESKVEKRGGEDVKVYTRGELVEATWVPIQSNRSASYGHVAKKFGLMNFDTEVKMLDKKYTQEEFDSEVEKQIKAKDSDLQKKMVEKDAEIAKLKKDAEEATAEAEKDAEEAKTETDKKLKEAKAEADTEKKKALEKQKFANEGGVAPEDAEKVDKAWKDGKVPIMSM